MDSPLETATSSAHNATAHVLVIGPGVDATRGLCDRLAAQQDPTLRVTQIESLNAGVTMLSDSQVDALVLDLSTEGVEPLDTCRLLRAVAPHVPIVLNAAPDQEAIAARALHEGADHYVLKGPSNDQLVASTVCSALRRARAEAELRGQQQRHRSLLDLMDDGVASIDANGCFIEANLAMARMLGYDHPDDLRGISLRDVYTGPETPDALITRLLSSGALPRGDAELLCRGGDRVTVILRGRRLGPAEHGTCDIVCTDVTTERRLEHEARDAEPLIVGGMFAAGIGVEVQRLMTAIKGAHGLLAEAIEDGHPRRPDLEYARETAAHAAGLIEELLGTMRRRTMRPAVLGARAAVERLQPVLQQTLGDIAVRIPPQDDAAGQVMFVAGELDRVIVELASVARALDPECPVTISTAPVYLDATYAREHLALMPGHYVAFLITTSAQSLDTLMAPDWEAERCFRRDVADRDTALELATTYRTVTHAGGHLTIRRPPGTGTTFKVYLPHVNGPGDRGTILLVEDEPSIRCGGRQLLELLDYRVLEAADPHEAIWLASRFDGEIDLLIADVVLPGMSGREMAERLVAGGYVSHVLYMSGLLKETLVERETLPSDVSFIEKPFTMAQLTERIREIVG
jgi:PAS domain S-box-containing protein